MSGEHTAPEIRSALQGQRFGICVASGAEELARRIEGVHGFARSLERSSLSDAQVLQSIDLLVVDAAGFSAPELDGLVQLDKPLLIAGPLGTVARLIEAVPGADFVIGVWTADELLLRASRLVSSSARKRGRQVPGHTVLVADDDPSTTAVLRVLFSSHGYECHVANDGAEALRLARSVEPAVAVLDVQMPLYDGFEVLTELKNDRRTRDIPVVLLTASNQESHVLRGFSLGADDYLTKPFSPMEVITRVKRLLRAARG